MRSAWSTARVWIVALFALWSGSAAAGEWFVTAYVDPDEAETTDIVTYTVTAAAENDSTALPRVTTPDFDDFMLLGKRTMKQALQIRPGVVRKATITRYQLRPIRTGTLTIPPAIVEAEGQVFKTESVTVEITPPTGGAKPSQPRPRSPAARRRRAPAPVKEPGDDFFIEVKASKTEAYIGEPIFVRYDLYRYAAYHASIFDFREPDFVDFWPYDATDDNKYQPRDPAIPIKGRDYKRELIKAYILVPMATGTLELAQTEAEVNRSGRSVAKSWIASPRRQLEVKALPEGAPDGFDAANISSDLRLRAELLSSDGGEAEVARVGDSLTLSVRVSGKGAVSQMELAPFEATPAMQVFGPNNREGGDEVNREALEGKQSMTFTVVPTTEGTLEVPPLRLPYFDPDAGRYDVLEAGPWTVEVTGFAPNADAILDQVDKEREAETTAARGAGPSLLAEPRDLGSGGGRGAPLYESLWFLLLLGAPPLLMVGARLMTLGQAKRASSSSERRTRKAAARADAALCEAQSKSGEARVDAVLSALRDYLEARAGVQPRGLTGTRLERALEEAGVSGETARRVSALLSEVEALRYAPAELGEELESVDEARALVATLDEEIGA